MEKAKSFFEQNWKWLLTSLILIAFNFGVTQTQLAMKTDKEEVRAIAKEEVLEQVEHYYPKWSGIKLETNYKNIKEQLDRIEKLLNRK